MKIVVGHVLATVPTTTTIILAVNKAWPTRGTAACLKSLHSVHCTVGITKRFLSWARGYFLLPLSIQEPGGVRAAELKPINSAVNYT